MSKSELIKTLLKELQGDHQRYKTLLDLLQQQHENMLVRNTELLDETNQQLQQLYQVLEKTALQRRSTLQQLGLPVNHDGMMQLFAKLPAAHQQKAATLWQELEQYAHQCKALNERNGNLLHMQIDIINSILNDGDNEDLIYTR